MGFQKMINSHDVQLVNCSYPQFKFREVVSLSSQPLSHISPLQHTVGIACLFCPVCSACPACPAFPVLCVRPVLPCPGRLHACLTPPPPPRLFVHLSLSPSGRSRQEITASDLGYKHLASGVARPPATSHRGPTASRAGDDPAAALD